MLEEETRISPVNVPTCPDDLRETLEEQRKLWGAPLYPYLFYARQPAYCRAAKSMGRPARGRDASARYA
jgi:hypothetical protein